MRLSTIDEVILTCEGVTEAVRDKESLGIIEGTCRDLETACLRLSREISSDVRDND